MRRGTRSAVRCGAAVLPRRWLSLARPRKREKRKEKRACWSWFWSQEKRAGERVAWGMVLTAARRACQGERKEPGLRRRWLVACPRRPAAPSSGLHLFFLACCLVAAIVGSFLWQGTKNTRFIEGLKYSSTRYHLFRRKARSDRVSIFLQG